MSDRFQFRGRVLPETIPLSLAYGPVVERWGVQGEPRARFGLSVTEGELQVDVELEAFRDGDHLRLHAAAYDLARSSVEVASLVRGVAFHVMLDEAVLPDGEVEALVLADRKLAARITAFGAHDLEAVTDLVLTDMNLARVLSDAVVMLSWPHYSPIAAGRVADSLARMLTGGRSPDHWSLLRDTLRVDRAYVQMLSDHSAPPRHGERLPLPGSVTSTLAARAWTLINRYLAYRLGGDAPLDPKRYPVLTGEAPDPSM